MTKINSGKMTVSSNNALPRPDALLNRRRRSLAPVSVFVWDFQNSWKKLPHFSFTLDASRSSLSTSIQFIGG